MTNKIKQCLWYTYIQLREQNSKTSEVLKSFYKQDTCSFITNTAFNSIIQEQER